jgi:hypothetical protein
MNEVNFILGQNIKPNLKSFRGKVYKFFYRKQSSKHYYGILSRWGSECFYKITVIETIN